MKRTSFFCFMVALLSFNTHAHQPSICFVSELVAPFYWLDENGAPQGANVDLAEAMKPLLPFSSTLEHMPWARAYKEAVNKPNIVLLTLLKSPTRSSQFHWLGAITTVNASLIGLAHNANEEIVTLEEVKSKRVGSIRGYGAAEYLTKQGFKENENLILVTEPQQLWNLLYSERIDYAATGFATSRYEIEAAGYASDKSVKAFELDMSKSELHMATGLETTSNEVIAIKNALQQLKENGEYQRIMMKWGLSPLHSAPPATLEQDSQRLIN
ncbi:transporter substrate-binding domain-containing protein [Alteromonas sp. MTD1]